MSISNNGEKLEGGEIQKKKAEHWEDTMEDASFAPDEEKFPVDPQRLEEIAQGAKEIGQESEEDYYRYIGEQAEAEGVPAEQLLTAVRGINKEQRFGKDREVVKFYHTTSIDGLANALNNGELVENSEQEDGNVDEEQSPEELSKNVEFSYDSFDDDGTMKTSGFGERQGEGKPEVSFVFGGDLMDEASFEATPNRPTVNRVNIEEKCLGIVVQDANDIKRVEAMLDEKGIIIPVYSAEEYDAGITPKKLREAKAHLKVEKSMGKVEKEQEIEKTIDEEEGTEKTEEPEKLEEEEKLTKEEDEQLPPEEEKEQEDERGAELLKESDVEEIKEKLADSKAMVDEIYDMTRGSYPAGEASMMLKMNYRDMLNQSDDFLEKLNSEHDPKALKEAESNFKKEIEDAIEYSEKALETIKGVLSSFSAGLADILDTDSQEVEEAVEKIKAIVGDNENVLNQQQIGGAAEEKLVGEVKI